MKKITILIADDHTLIRETWAMILNNDNRYKVVAECGTGEDAITLASKHLPDVIIMDVSLPGMNGIQATEIINKKLPQCHILGISLHTQPSYAKKMMQKGALGYLTKSSSKEEMFLAINYVARGEKYICEEIKNILSEQMFNAEEVHTGLHELSTREMEIISYLKKGFSSKEIALDLGISTKTVEVHRYNILKKLNLKNTASLINFINNVEPELG